MSAAGNAGTPTSASMGTNNPLFNTAPSPLNSQLGAQNPAAAAAAPASAANAAPNAAGAPRAEAEMLQQLMSEINRLRSELGDSA